MKGTVKNGGFWGYFRAQYGGLRAVGKRNGNVIISFLFSLLLLIVMGQANADPEIGFMNIITLSYLFALLLFATGGMLKAVHSRKPSLVALYPATYARRAAYGCVGALLSAIIFYAVIMLVIFVIILLPFALVCFLANLWRLFLEFAKAALSVNMQIDACGALFIAFYIILTYGAGLIYGNLGGKKARYIFAACFIAVMEALVLIMANLNAGGGFVWFSSCIRNFSAVPLYPLWLSLMAVGAVISVVLGVLLAFRREKPKDF